MSASHVVVIDSTARRAVIKVTPSTHLSDVLQQACTKLSLRAAQYGLRKNNKQIDLSRTIRLSGLSSGAKLELVLLSRSPSVVSVALQLPDGEPQGAPSGRLVDKFPSTTTLWLILRKFESGAGGESRAVRNFTARGAPQTSNGESGSGRLYYETPVLHIMGRELSSFEDLQKTLGQLGFNAGSVLIRLSFRVTETPLDEAVLEIDRYFKSAESENPAGAHAGSVATMESVPDADNPDGLADGASVRSPAEESGDAVMEGSSVPLGFNVTGSSLEKREEKEEEVGSDTVVGPDQRPMAVYAPPSDSTPQAARHTFNEADYEPTIDHAKLHQSRLSGSGRNRRLPSEAEVKAAEEEASRKLASIGEVEIKIRYPDQTQVVSKFTSMDTVEALYGFVQSTLQHPDQPFSLSYSSGKGPRVIPRQPAEARLIRDVGLSGRLLINFIWDQSAGSQARSESALKSEFAAAAREIKVEEVEPVTSVGEEAEGGGTHQHGKEKASAKGQGRKGMPKWLKLGGKK